MATDRKIKAALARLPKERQHFSPLTLANPNYFGNDPKSTFKSGVAKPFVNQTTYEQLRCVGLNPQFDYVEAVVDIKQDAGQRRHLLDRQLRIRPLLRRLHEHEQLDRPRSRLRACA